MSATIIKLPTASLKKIRNRQHPARQARKDNPWPKKFNPPWLREINERRDAINEFGELRGDYIDLTKSPVLLLLMCLLPELPLETQAKIAMQIEAVHIADPSAATHDALLLIGGILAKSAAKAKV